jgi:hypothetical protein
MKNYFLAIENQSIGSYLPFQLLPKNWQLLVELTEQQLKLYVSHDSGFKLEDQKIISVQNLACNSIFGHARMEKPEKKNHFQ